MARRRYNPDWVADRYRIMFLNAVEAGWPIWVVDANGTGAQELVACDDGCQALDAPSWSPEWDADRLRPLLRGVAAHQLHDPSGDQESSSIWSRASVGRCWTRRP